MGANLKDKVAIVTGASRGLGREYAKALAAAGAQVIAADIKDCAETVEEITSAEHSAIGIELDVRDQESCRNMANTAVSHFGKIDILVNNAALYGSLGTGRFDTLDDKDWDDCMDVNVNGIWRCSKAVINSMRENKSGSIINISSLAALAGLPYALHYSTSKAAVIGMTRAMARELGKDWIRVNAVGPGPINTPMLSDPTEGNPEQFGGMVPMQRIGTPKEISDAVLWLFSPQSSYVTGHTLMIDGGFCAQ